MRQFTPTSQEPHVDAVKPFGRYGIGTLTGHPAGLLVVAAVIFLTFETVPGSGWFVAAALVVGGVFGFFLWLRRH